LNTNIIDVLVYIFENYIDSETEEEMDQILLEEDLAEAGFPEIEIKKAFNWLDELAWQQGEEVIWSQTADQAFRIYCEKEKQQIDIKTQNFLYKLEQAKILTPLNRERVIERIMAIETPDLNLEDIKWIILLVLSNQPDQDVAFAIIQDLVYNDTIKTHH